MGAAERVKVARSRPVAWWWRVRHGHATAERHLDALADAMRSRGWAYLKVYVEFPPVLWVFSKGAEDAALNVIVKRIDGCWVYRIAQSIQYPCDAPAQVASMLDDVLRERMGPHGVRARP